MKVLVVGMDGRGHELARQLSLSSKIKQIYCAPGNGGTAALPKTENVDIAFTDVPKLVEFASSHKIDLAVISPEGPLELGLADKLRAAGVTTFGPNQQAAKLETSKKFAAEFMDRHNLPQPKYWKASSLDGALEIIKDKQPSSYVLKADGLAGGKGVILPETEQEAKEVLEAMFGGEAYEGSGKNGVVIQERLHGPEVSGYAVVDGKDYLILPSAQDHKRIDDGDKGLNTGGMGAYTPLPESVVSLSQAKKINDLAAASIEGILKDKMDFNGFLYTAYMLAEERGGDPVIIEYNVRFGDPEAEAVLPALSEGGFDVAEMLIRAAKGELGNLRVPKKLPKAVVSVTISSAGYPESSNKGDIIHGLDKTYEDVIIHHAGTKKDGDNIVTNGGRVLFVTGLGKDLEEAAQKAYGAIGPEGINFDGMHYRTDIGAQALK